MSVELILARPATGKTRACIQKAQDAITSVPLATIWVIVPDRLQAAAFRNWLAQSRAAWRIAAPDYRPKEKMEQDAVPRRTPGSII